MEILGTWIRDIRRTCTSLARQPGMAIAALLSLALGIGANVALFSVVDGVLMRPLPYPGEERLVRLWEEHEGAQSMVRAPLLSNYTYEALKDASLTLEGIGAYGRNRYIETRDDRRSYLEGASASPVLFSFLGTRPALGRLLAEEDAEEGAPPVVLLSYGFWQRRFGGEDSVLGKTLELDGEARTIVGVAEKDFYFPDREASLWVPQSIVPPSTNPEESSISVFSALAKLKPGVTAAQAAAESTALARGMERPPIT
ncbi:MAG: ABC transporter permease, partial [Acidobacteria bacterium]|nr:ABC transporter permease [Acidobacteriota bacterium]